MTTVNLAFSLKERRSSVDPCLNGRTTNQNPTRHRVKRRSYPIASKLKRTELQHKPSSIPGREIVQVLTEIPACVESGWHQHPGEEVGYILAGTVEMKIKDQPTLTSTKATHS